MPVGLLSALGQDTIHTGKTERQSFMAKTPTRPNKPDKNEPEHVSMFDRWDMDDANPAQAWFDNIDDLKSAITGFDSHGIPIFDPKAGNPTLDNSNSNNGKDESSPGKPSQNQKQVPKSNSDPGAARFGSPGRWRLDKNGNPEWVIGGESRS